MSFRWPQSSLVAVLVLAPVAASAFCEDPETGVSGYHVPLRVETKDSVAIVLGKVIQERKINDDPSDPESFLFTIYTVRLTRTLKGSVPEVFTLYSTNDSARYSMTPGETHLLFIRAWSYKVLPTADYRIDSCGNSSALPAGNTTVAKVTAELRRGANAP
jgi:hypothetical protein